MKVVLDTSVLMYLVSPNASAPVDQATGKPVVHCQERVEGLLEGFDKADVQLLVPTPVLSELLIRAEDRQLEVLATLTNKKSVQVPAFDQAAAVENAALRRTKIARKARSETKKEVSFDLQILAIARVAGAKAVLSDDEQLRKRAQQAGMEVLGIADLSVPDNRRQMQMLFAEGGNASDDDAAPAEDADKVPDVDG